MFPIIFLLVSGWGCYILLKPPTQAEPKPRIVSTAAHESGDFIKALPYEVAKNHA